MYWLPTGRKVQGRIVAFTQDRFLSSGAAINQLDETTTTTRLLQASPYRKALPSIIFTANTKPVPAVLVNQVYAYSSHKMSEHHFKGGNG